MDSHCEECLQNNVKIFPDPTDEKTNIHWCNTCGHQWFQKRE